MAALSVCKNPERYRIPLGPIPRSRSPASPQKSGISQHPRFNSRTGDRSKTYRVRARADGASGEKCRAKTKLVETTTIPAVPRRHEPEKREFRNKNCTYKTSARSLLDSFASWIHLSTCSQTLVEITVDGKTYHIPSVYNDLICSENYLGSL